jgi:hypothetical protein
MRLAAHKLCGSKRCDRADDVELSTELALYPYARATPVPGRSVDQSAGNGGLSLLSYRVMVDGGGRQLSWPLMESPFNEHKRHLPYGP